MASVPDTDILLKHPGWRAYARFLHRFDWAVVLLSLALFAVCFHYVKQIRIKSDFKEMLPERYQSVIEFNKLEKRTRSTGNLVVLVGGAPWEAMRRFIDDFAARAATELTDDVSRVEYNAKTASDYFDKNKYLYIDLPDLEEIDRRLTRQIDFEKLDATGLYLNLEDERPKFDVSDIEDKYKSKTGNFLNYKDGYFTTKDADLAAVILKPRAGATDVEFAEGLMAKAGRIIADMNPASYDPGLRTTFAGRYQKVVREYKALIGDILRTTILCLMLVGGVILLYYRRLRPCILTTIAVTQGVLVALAIGSVVIGYLTTQTAFLGSIIVGNGINYSLILLARWLEERRDRGRETAEALAVALSQTWKPTLVAAATTSTSFAVLMITNIRGFSQFGFIGGIGMVVCWCCSFFFLPAWMSLFERAWATKVAAKEGPRYYWLFGRLARFVVERNSAVLRVTAGLSLFAVLVSAWYLPHSLEYNFDNMKFKPPKETGDSWETYARDRLNDIFSQSTTPAVVLTDRPDQAEPVCKVIRAKAETPAFAGLLDDCKTLDTFVPKDQEAKLSALAHMRQQLSSSTLNFLDEEQKKEVEKFKATLDLRVLTLKDVPDSIVTNFEEADGSLGKIAYVYPKPTANLWNGKELIRFADLIREVDLPDGEKIYSSGESVIFADLLRVVVKEGPIATALSFAAVLALILITFKGTREGAIVMGTLILGVLWLILLLPFAGVKLNFLNFIALPITFGIGVDYAVNISQRYRQDGPGSIAGVLTHTGGAVLLCSLTTIIGYSVLMTSRSLGLRSFGLVALLGEFTCLAAAIVSLPSFIAWLEVRKSRAAEGVGCASEAR